MIHIAVCDDNELEARRIKKYVEKFMGNANIPVKLELYVQSHMLKCDIEEGKVFDLILSDIEMPGIGGMELAAYIRRQLPHALIIFITAHLRYAVDGYSLSVFRYIPKCELEVRLLKALEDAVNMIQLQKKKYYWIETATRYEKIPYCDIIYIKREGKYSNFVLLDGEERVRKSLSKVYEEIGSEDFVYANRGEILNLNHIWRFKKDVAILENNIRISVSSSNLKEIKEKMGEFWGKRV